MLGEARLRVSVGDTIVGAQGTRENHVKDGGAPGRDQGCPYGQRGGPRVPWTCGLSRLSAECLRTDRILLHMEVVYSIDGGWGEVGRRRRRHLTSEPGRVGLYCWELASQLPFCPLFLCAPS